MFALVPKVVSFEHPNLGQFVGPRSWWTPDGSLPWAADNDSFNSFDPDRFRDMLDRLTDIGDCLFITAPDAVADADETNRLWKYWRPEIDEFPAAYVLQDGATMRTVPWNECEAVFIGGTTEWKYTDTVHRLVEYAKMRRKWVHMGRVNTRRRIRYAASIGCDSFDGTNTARWTDAHLPWVLDWAAAQTQPQLGGTR